MDIKKTWARYHRDHFHAAKGLETFPLEPSELVEPRVGRLYTLFAGIEGCQVIVTWEAPLTPDKIAYALGELCYLGPGSEEAPLDRRVWHFRIRVPYAAGTKLINGMHGHQFPQSVDIIDLVDPWIGKPQDQSPALAQGLDPEKCFEYYIQLSIPYRRLDEAVCVLEGISQRRGLYELTDLEKLRLVAFTQFRYGVPIQDSQDPGQPSGEATN